MLVTGRGEEQFLPDFFRAIGAPGPEGCVCVFKVIRRVPQLHPITAGHRIARMVRTGQPVPTLDEDIALAGMRFLRQHPGSFVMLVDDLEHDRRHIAQGVFDRYRAAFDTVLADLRWRASAHFLVNMVEAYYFGDPDAAWSALGLKIMPPTQNVETIRHPKNDLKELCAEFDEVSHGREICRIIDLDKVLQNPTHCAALRTLVAWCFRAAGRSATARFQLKAGQLYPVTATQLDLLPEVTA